MEIKYFLNFSPYNDGSFTLETIEEHDTVFEGNLEEIARSTTDWQNALDVFFEEHLNIHPNEWEIG